MTNMKSSKLTHKKVKHLSSDVEEDIKLAHDTIYCVTL